MNVFIKIFVITIISLSANSQCRYSYNEQLFVPNAFTPNDDGFNDKLYVYGTGTFVIKIFDRWGELVFQTNDFNEGWDGTYKGSKLNPGVFVFYIKSECAKPIKGSITILR